MALLLDHVLRKRLNVPARTRAEALVAIGIPHDCADSWPEVFEPVEQMLKEGSAGAMEAVLALLRDSPLHLGRPRRVLRLRDDKERRVLRRLERLAARVNHGGPFVMGLSAHQAKGKEWDRVGVCLAHGHMADLASGLTLDDETHRKLYVALTRGRWVTGQVPTGTTTARA